MLFLNKLLPVFFLPFGLACLLVLFALWRKKWWPGLLALAVLYLASMPVIANFLLGRLEALNPPVKLADAPPADAVYVLGGILSRLPRAGELPSWSDSSERFDGGVELVKAGKAAWLVLPGDRWRVGGRDWVEGDVLRDLAIARGVPPERILVGGCVANTRDEARTVAALMAVHGWKKILLVTSSWHMPRTAHLFLAAGVNFSAFPVDYGVQPGSAMQVTDFVPRAQAWEQTERTLRECYGLAFYTLTGR